MEPKNRRESHGCHCREIWERERVDKFGKNMELINWVAVDRSTI
jgi:hypothetical protein